jgi:glycosyltransferase involved in cell wall biosynthesis
MTNFSIILPSYNRCTIIERAINSVLNQTFKDFELIIVDDGSTDTTKEVVARFNDDRINYYFQKNSGVSAARNNGARFAIGNYLIFLDSDDDIEINWLSDFFSLSKQNFDLLFCNFKIVRINGEESLISASNALYQGDKKGPIIPGSWAIRKELFFKAGMYDEKLKFGENTELRFRLQEHQISIGIVNQYNFIYYQSQDGGSKNLKNKIESNLYIIEKHPNYFRKNKNMLRFYYQNIAVAYAKLEFWESARVYFWKAYLVDKLKLKTFARFFISLFPFLGRKIWIP